jgi:uncharacterized lipoprotein YddW (UPF0748 family)
MNDPASPRRRYILLLLLICLCPLLKAQTPTKRAFRGAWVHTVGQSKYATMSQTQMKAYFNTLLDSLKEAGINAILFQVRPEADAWYVSELEPWSRYITGQQGKDPGWDPLAFMVQACHERGMELHAWLNPYRVKTSLSNKLAPNHIYYKHPDWFIPFDNLLWFDPGNPECRTFIKNVVRDLVKHYDIDAVHMDDYFYPYPVSGKTFDDSRSFRTYGFAMGFLDNQKAAWRRENVNVLIRDLYTLIHQTKPWVQFGVSPFGIWRNLKTDPKGSKTNGLSNYDDLYADILTWLEKGWVDYNIPQLYWEIGHKNADYQTLIDWWANHTYGKALYIGQDVLRSVKADSQGNTQLYRKMMLAERPEVLGHCFWPAYELENNAGHIRDSLRRTYFKYPALLPANNPFDQKPPKPVQELHLRTVRGKALLEWKTDDTRSETDKQVRFVIYRFASNQRVNIDDPKAILAITTTPSYELPAGSKGHGTLVVTALDRCWNESEPTPIVLP